jgi:hypothetical protein
MTSLKNLQYYSEKGDRFLDLTVTAVEMWVLHFTPEFKQHTPVCLSGRNSAECHPLGSWCSRSFGIAEDHSHWISCHEVPPSMRTATVAHSHLCLLPSGKNAWEFSWTVWFSSITMPGLLWQTGLPTGVIQMGDYGASTIQSRSHPGSIPGAARFSE